MLWADPPRGGRQAVDDLLIKGDAADALHLQDGSGLRLHLPGLLGGVHGGRGVCYQGSIPPQTFEMCEPIGRCAGKLCDESSVISGHSVISVSSGHSVPTSLKNICLGYVIRGIIPRLVGCVESHPAYARVPDPGSPAARPPGTPTRLATQSPGQT